ncbi:MAG: NUDIX domain-containing protein [Nanoarchaeota archaeon]
MQNYSIEKSDEGIDLSRDNVRGLELEIVQGLCRANKDAYFLPRDIKWYDENVLNPMIQRGEISDGSRLGSFDDRKMRYDGSSLNLVNRSLKIRLGHSHFKDYIEKKKRSKEETQELVRLGLRHFNDPYSFFGRNPGVTGVVMTSDKKLIIGERQVEKDMYEGLLQGVAGHLSYKQTPSDIKLEEEMLREIEEETGIKKTDVKKMGFLGVFSFTDVAGDDLDFCFLVDTNIHSEYFNSKEWKSHVKKPEHKEFLAIPNYRTLREMLDGKEYSGKRRDIVFSTRGALEEIKERGFN